MHSPGQPASPGRAQRPCLLQRPVVPHAPAAHPRAPRACRSSAAPARPNAATARLPRARALRTHLRTPRPSTHAQPAAQRRASAPAARPARAHAVPARLLCAQHAVSQDTSLLARRPMSRYKTWPCNTILPFKPKSLQYKIQYCNTIPILKIHLGSSPSRFFCTKILFFFSFSFISRNWKNHKKINKNHFFFIFHNTSNKFIKIYFLHFSSILHHIKP